MSMSMSFLKSIYIGIYLMASIGIMGYAGWMLYQGAGPVAWAGVLLTTTPVIMLIARLTIFKNMARTRLHLPLVSGLATTGAVMAIWAWSENLAGLLPPVIAITGLVGFLVYCYWYSDLGRKLSDRIKVGDQIADFTVFDVRNKPVSAKELTGRPAILIFFRGNWCPLCLAQ